MHYLVYIFLFCLYDTATGQVNASVVDGECSSHGKCCTKNTILGSCPDCKNGYHGLRCALLCPDKCRPTCTDHPDKERYPGYANCTFCIGGYYSTTKSFQCQTLCSDGCKECISFMKPTENCKTCKNGYYLVLLSGKMGRCDKCPTNCIACTSAESCTTCSLGYFGIICNGNCSLGCKDAVCDKGTGKCTNGCESEYFENNDTCDNCKAGKYGRNCTENCSSACLNTKCEKYTGDCVRCTGNFDGSQCDKCKYRYYGTHCDKTCSKHCQDGLCEQQHGDCVSCKEGFIGKYCSTCVAGKYGPDCNLACPEYCMNNICNRSTGNCEDCADNFSGPKCDICKNGFHGQACSLTCSKNCRGGICNRINGTCSSCVPYRYWSFCEKYCSANCNTLECHLETGLCINGCKSDYSGDKCCANHGNCLKCSTNDLCLECVHGMYGETCNESCHNCLDNKCFIENGTCLQCQVAYKGLFCNETSLVTEKHKGDTEKGQVGVITGSVVGVAVFLSLIVVTLCIFRKRLQGRLFRTSGSQNRTAVLYENQNFTNSQSYENLNTSTASSLQDKKNHMNDGTKEVVELGNIQINVIDTENHERGDNTIYEGLTNSGQADNPYTALHH